MYKELIPTVEDLVQYMHSFFSLAPRRAQAESEAGLILRTSVFTDFLCSEYQGKLTIHGKTYQLEAVDNGFGTVRVRINHQFKVDK